MTPDTFAEMHPRLYRLAMSGAHRGIRKHGLLTAAESCARAGVPLPDTPRPTAMHLSLPDGTPVALTDNSPLSFKRLAPALDDDLRPEDWLAMLNARVFFWPKREYGEGNLRARKRFGYQSEWQVYDTKLLLTGVWRNVEIAPINTGATVRRPARRGLSTFAPLDGIDLPAWRRRRAKKSPDTIREVTVLGSVFNAGDALVSVEAA